MKNKKEETKETPTTPVIRELFCYVCNSAKHTVIGWCYLGFLMTQCSDCGVINSLKLSTSDEPQVQKPELKRRLDYLG